MNQEPTTHDKLLEALEDASMYQDLSKDARELAAGTKERWSKLRDRLGTVKQDHEQWRQGHKISAWLHDNGWLKSNGLAQHEDRQRRYTTREVKAYIANLDARDKVQRFDEKLVQAQEQASQGWRQLEQEQQAQERLVAQQRQSDQSLAINARTVQLEHAAPREKGPADRFTGELLESGSAPYLHKNEKSQSFFVKLRLDDGKEAKHWGVDLQRTISEAEVSAGDRIQVEKTGADRSVEVKEDGQVIPAVRKGWHITNLSHDQKQSMTHDHDAPEQALTPEPVGRETIAQPVLGPRIEAMSRVRAGADVNINEAIQSATQEREHMTQTQSFGSIELPRTKQEMQQEQSRANLGQRVLENNVSLPQPGRYPTLSQRIQQLQQEQTQTQDDQGQGSGGRRGGQERPSHSSYYQAVPSGGMAPPTTDERSAAIQQQERSRRRASGRSI